MKSFFHRVGSVQSSFYKFLAAVTGTVLNCMGGIDGDETFRGEAQLSFQSGGWP